VICNSRTLRSRVSFDAERRRTLAGMDAWRALRLRKVSNSIDTGDGDAVQMMLAGILH